jgi:hypothetical protein
VFERNIQLKSDFSLSMLFSPFMYGIYESVSISYNFPFIYQFVDHVSNSCLYSYSLVLQVRMPSPFMVMIMNLA